MSVTFYSPDPVYVAGNVLVGIAPAIENINAPKLSELQASTMIQCATETFGSSTNVQKQSRKMLCDRVGKETISDRTYQMEQMTVMAGNLQESNQIIDLLQIDSIQYIWTRPGVPDNQPLKAGDKVIVHKVGIDAVDARPFTTTGGEEFALLVNTSVKGRSEPLLATVVA